MVTSVGPPQLSAVLPCSPSVIRRKSLLFTNTTTLGDGIGCELSPVFEDNSVFPARLDPAPPDGEGLSSLCANLLSRCNSHDSQSVTPLPIKAGALLLLSPCNNPNPQSWARHGRPVVPLSFFPPPSVIRTVSILAFPAPWKKRLVSPCFAQVAY